MGFFEIRWFCCGFEGNAPMHKLELAYCTKDVCGDDDFDMDKFEI